MTVRMTRATLVAATAGALSVALAAPALAATPAGAGHDQTRKAMEAAVDAGVPGVTAKDGHGTWSATAGDGNRRTGEPRSAEDRYWDSFAVHRASARW